MDGWARWFLIDDYQHGEGIATATITVPSQVTCGVPRTLTATTSDPNSDIASTRWLVDGVLLASSVSSVTFTGAHELSVRVRDSRGATTTAKKVVSCL